MHKIYNSAQVLFIETTGMNSKLHGKDSLSACVKSNINKGYNGSCGGVFGSMFQHGCTIRKVGKPRLAAKNTFHKSDTVSETFRAISEPTNKRGLIFAAVLAIRCLSFRSTHPEVNGGSHTTASVAELGVPVTPPSHARVPIHVTCSPNPVYFCSHRSALIQSSYVRHNSNRASSRTLFHHMRSHLIALC